jgi:hypothetical protein
MHNMLEKAGGVGGGKNSATCKMAEGMANKFKVKVKRNSESDSSCVGTRRTASMTVTHVRTPAVLDLRPIAARTELHPAALPDRSPLGATMNLSRGLESDVKEVKRLIRNYVGRLNEKEKSLVAAKEWRNLSRVVDRLFFYVYLAAIIVSLVALFPRQHDKRDESESCHPH